MTIKTSAVKKIHAPRDIPPQDRLTLDVPPASTATATVPESIHPGHSKSADTSSEFVVPVAQAVPEVDSGDLEHGRMYVARKIIVVLAVILSAIGIVVGLISGKPSEPSAPSAPPGAVAALRDSVCSRLPSTCSDLSTYGSPQNQALMWVASNPSFTSLSEQRRIQKYVLGVVYFSLERWGDGSLRDWMHLPEDECTWDSDVACDEAGRITRIDTKSHLTARGGPLPRDVVLLSDSLEELALSWNTFGGKIPSEYSVLGNLKVLLLNDNELTGTVPTWISQLTGLERLWLDDNDFTGSMPEEVCRLFDANETWIKDVVADCNSTVWKCSCCKTWGTCY